MFILKTREHVRSHSEVTNNMVFIHSGTELQLQNLGIWIRDLTVDSFVIFFFKALIQWISGCGRESTTKHLVEETLKTVSWFLDLTQIICYSLVSVMLFFFYVTCLWVMIKLCNSLWNTCFETEILVQGRLIHTGLSLLLGPSKGQS